MSVIMKVKPYCKVSFRESKLLYKVIHPDGLKVRLHSKGSCQDKDCSKASFPQGKLCYRESNTILR